MHHARVVVFCPKRINCVGILLVKVTLISYVERDVMTRGREKVDKFRQKMWFLGDEKIAKKVKKR